MKKVFLVTVQFEQKPPKRFVTDSVDNIIDVCPDYIFYTIEPVEFVDVSML